MLHALVSVNDAILAAHTANENPRTTLALALARPADDLLITASVGDSHLFVAGEQQVVEALSRQRQSKFLGHEPRKPSQLARDVRIEVQPLGRRARAAGRRPTASRSAASASTTRARR